MNKIDAKTRPEMPAAIAKVRKETLIFKTVIEQRPEEENNGRYIFVLNAKKK